jgi:hypothetical protein
MNIEFKVEKNKLKFAVYGCWNRGCHINQSINHDHLNAIQKNIDFLILTGDNIYPIKKNDKKVYDMNTFMNGIECLLKSKKGVAFKKDIYLVFGNHDISSKQDNCSIFEKQLSMSKDIPNLHFMIPFYKVSYNLLGFSISLFYIDTNIYDEDMEQTCYSKRRDYIELLQKQSEWLHNALETSKSNWNIVVGHHPLISIKYKSGQNQIIKLDGLLDILGRHSGNKIIYLCADLHMFQKWDIIHKNDIDIKTQYADLPMIKQYIMGTGGAELDYVDLQTIKAESDGYINGKLFEDSKRVYICNGIIQTKNKW